MFTYWKLVRTKIGCRKNDGTDSSINAWVFMKFRVKSGSVRESLTHCPGRGSGTCNIHNMKIKKLHFLE